VSEQMSGNGARERTGRQGWPGHVLEGDSSLGSSKKGGYQRGKENDYNRNLQLGGGDSVPTAVLQRRNYLKKSRGGASGYQPTRRTVLMANKRIGWEARGEKVCIGPERQGKGIAWMGGSSHKERSKGARRKNPLSLEQRGFGGGERKGRRTPRREDTIFLKEQKGSRHRGNHIRSDLKLGVVSHLARGGSFTEERGVREGGEKKLPYRHRVKAL